VSQQQTLRTLVAHLGSSLNCGRRENSSWIMSTKVCSEDLRRSSASCIQRSTVNAQQQQQTNISSTIIIVMTFITSDKEVTYLSQFVSLSQWKIIEKVTDEFSIVLEERRPQNEIYSVGFLDH